MKVLVTGGSGFIGTHLCRQLLKAGHEPIIFDLVAPSIDLNDSSVRYIPGDIRSSSDLQNAVRDVDAVAHFAAIVSVPLCNENQVESYRTNFLGTCEVLEAVRLEMKRSGRKIRVIFSGSAAVYGDSGQLALPIHESQTLLSTLSFYGNQKLASEQVISMYRKTHQVPVVAFRFFNVYGPGQKADSPYSGVITVFANRLRKKQILSLHGGGLQTRDFVSVHDVARAAVLALQLPDEACDGVPINLGTSSPVSIRELATEMAKALGHDPVFETGPSRAGDIAHSCANIERAKSVLNWHPEKSLKQGLAELLNG